MIRPISSYSTKRDRIHGKCIGTDRQQSTREDLQRMRRDLKHGFGAGTSFEGGS